jgi:hypothetical protein
MPFEWRLAPDSLLDAPEVHDLLWRGTRRPRAALILTREPLPAGELARAIRAFVPHAGAAAGVLGRAHIADGAVVLGAGSHGEHLTRNEFEFHASFRPARPAGDMRHYGYSVPLGC